MKSVFHKLRTLKEYQEIIKENSTDGYVKTVCDDAKELIKKIEKILQEIEAKPE